MTFDIDSDMILNTVFSAMDNADVDDLSDNQIGHIIQQVNNSIPGLIQLLTYDAESVWKNEAIASGGWGGKYANAIRSYFADGEGKVYIDETVMDKGSNKPNIMFAMMMEKGVKSWSIKDALLASDKAKTSKDGIRYIIIPFQVATPRKAGAGKMNSRFGGREMSPEIHAIVKAGGQVPEGSTVPVTTVSGKKDVSIAGLTRFNTRQFHSGYGMFRVVTDKSKGWMYPDVPAEPVFANVQRQVNQRIGEALAELCKSIVADNT